MRKALLVLIDGLGDVSIAQLGHQTPLQAAKTPYLDALAASGLNGLVDPVRPGVACGSDTAHLSLLGYDPAIYYRGRGAFESLGAGLEMDDGDVGFKCNFAFVDDSTGIVKKRRADRNFESIGPVLCQALNGLRLEVYPEVEIRVKYATEHRCGIVLHGSGLSDRITGTDPLRDDRPLGRASPLDDSPEAIYTAAVVNAASDLIQTVLETHPINEARRQSGQIPANAILFRGPGQRMKAPSFRDQTGLNSCVLAPTKIIAGLGLSLGMELISADGATGSYDTLLSSKAAVMCKSLVQRDYQFGFLHIKAVDDAGHDQDIQLKVTLLEQVDRMMGQIIKRLWMTGVTPQPVVVVTSDHSTPVMFGDHSNEPVPITITFLEKTVEVLGADRVAQIDESAKLQAFDASPGAHQPAGWARQKGPYGDSVEHFDEICAAEGALGRFQGRELMPLIQRLMQHP